MNKQIISSEKKECGLAPGAVYSVAHFFDINANPCNKEDAVRIDITEYDKEDRAIVTHHFLSGPSHDIENMFAMDD